MMAGMSPAGKGQSHGLESSGSIADIEGLLLGHDTLSEGPTGCTVVVAPEGAVGGVTQPGGAPGTRELGLLDPINTVDSVHAVVLSGGSAFGLDSASGVVRRLEEQGIGFPVGGGVVPIVVGGVLYDLAVGDPAIRPDGESGYRATGAALDGSAVLTAEGSVGAGAGATVGKLLGPERAMRGGVGMSSVELDDGVVVAALAAVNAMGDVVDPATGDVVAGARSEDGRSLVDARELLRGGRSRTLGEALLGNTTLAVVATNARLDKAGTSRLALMASAGMARAIVPVWTPGDGDTVFALATGKRGSIDVGLLGGLAAEMLSVAIVRGVRLATSGL